ncbi:APC family permease [Desulfotalea psychrophila]|uniref:Probable proton-linked D-serine/D-alanine/glycine symporter n=1 Tax=Desulfotalea psychrophila (strain LSv54 / DSM 12343) TaxID=177439 RepID=Q6APS6_DESPS|nr:amino acid permease [Desulfotalea psychrophila]CAG35648.1 probable proton-linked D-serine/D-alanine/glycine symporter [Desulfotalea psychrophila LSv54]
MAELQKKYGFWTATAMVVGIVIGSGVFFKADNVLRAAGGSLPIALLAWAIGGAIMIVTAYVFSLVANRMSKVNGVSDYFESAYGKTASYFVGWFMAIVYYPSLVAVLAWVSANYSTGLIGKPDWLWPLAFAYMVVFFLLNVFSPVLAGKWQVSTTIIKLIPLGLVAIVGAISGLMTGQTLESFSVSATVVGDNAGGLAVATLATAFAYEGWILATSINAELEDAKKNLPRALVVGTLAVALIYMLYYLGISGVLSNADLIAAGDAAPVNVISIVFGNIGGTVLTVFVVLSCLGTLNGLIMASSRGMYVVAYHGQGPKPKFFAAVNATYNSTLNSALVGFVISTFWLGVWYGNFAGWWGGFLDISELPIAFLYVCYIAIYIWVIRAFDELGPLSRYLAPFCAGLGSLYIIWGASQKDFFSLFLVILAAIFAVGFILKDEQSCLR